MDKATSTDDTEPSVNKYSLLKAVPLIAIGAGIGAFAVPGVMTAVGFTSSGIAAKSMAAYLMKCSAIAYGGGVPAGGAVAILQSIGAKAGVSYLYATLGGSGGGAVYYKLFGGRKDTETKKDDTETKKDDTETKKDDTETKKDDTETKKDDTETKKD